jgi:uncharacterized protein YndB with AHSA1/START domain
MSERQHRGRQLTARIRIRARPEEVWEAWTDGARVLSWNMSEGEAPEIEHRLETALDRLSTALSHGAASNGPLR